MELSLEIQQNCWFVSSWTVLQKLIQMLSENFCSAPSLIDNPLVTLFCTSLTKRWIFLFLKVRFLAKPKRASSLWSFGLTKSLQMSAFPLFTPPVCYLCPHTSRLSLLRPCSAITQGHVADFTRYFSVLERHIIVCHAGMARLPRRHGTSAAPPWHVCRAGVANN